MKAVKILSFAFLFISFLSAKANEYPWEKYGFKFKVVTLSNGKYQEFHDLEDVVEIGSVLYNTQTKQIVGFVEKDTLYSEADLTPHIVSRWLSPDPLTEEYSSWSPYNYVMNNPLIFVDPDGQKVKLANNHAGAMTNIAQIAATSLGSQVMSQLIGRNETYTMSSTFFSSSSSYNPDNRKISYVGDPWYDEVPYDGGALTSMVAMGHESLHAFDHSTNAFNSSNAGARKGTLEPRAVSFANYLRDAYDLDPSRNRYGSIKGDFHQFSGDGSEKISNFTTLGSNEAETSMGFSYTKTTTTVLSYKKMGIFKVPNETKTETSTYYMTVSMDADNNVSFQIYNNEKDYNNATSNW